MVNANARSCVDCALQTQTPEFENLSTANTSGKRKRENLAEIIQRDESLKDTLRETLRRSVDEIGDPKKSSAHYEVSIRHFYTLYSVNKTLLDAI